MAEIEEQDEGDDLLVGLSSDTPILIDGGLKSFGLEKGSGKICLMLGARDLCIAWGKDPQYWKYESSSDSRFPEVVRLLDVCWFEIFGKAEIQMLSPKTIYGAYFVIKFAEENYGFDGVHVRSWIKFGTGYEERRVFLQRWQKQQKQQEGDFLRERGDGWMEIEMGEVYNDGEDGEVEMHLLEAVGGHWKSGLIVQGMELRPKRMTSVKKSMNNTNTTAVLDVDAAPPATGVTTPILATQHPPPAPVHTVHGERPEKFNGTDFKRWQQKMLFYLTTLNLGKFLKEITHVPKPGETDRTTVATIDSWHHSDFLCINYILNGLDNILYNVYSPFKTAKALWESLENKYKTEDVGLKKFVVGRFLDFTMNDGQTVMNQEHQLQLLMHEIKSEGMSINEPFQVAAVIEKLPPGWKDFKNYLKH